MVFRITANIPGNPNSGVNVNWNSMGLGSGQNVSVFSRGGGRWIWRCQAGCASRKSYATRAQAITLAKAHLKNHDRGHMHYGMNLRF